MRTDGHLIAAILQEVLRHHRVLPRQYAGFRVLRRQPLAELRQLAQRHARDEIIDVLQLIKEHAEDDGLQSPGNAEQPPRQAIDFGIAAEPINDEQQQGEADGNQRQFHQWADAGQDRAYRKRRAAHHH